MPTQKTFKRRVRAPAAKTGESYTAARQQLLRKAATPKGPGRTTVAVQHEKLPDAASAEREKAAWRERLVALKAFLDGDRPTVG